MIKKVRCKAWHEWGVFWFLRIGKRDGHSVHPLALKKLMRMKLDQPLFIDRVYFFTLQLYPNTIRSRRKKGVQR